MRALRNVAVGVCTTLLGALLTTAAAAPALADPLDPVDSVEVSAEQQSIAPGVSLERRTTLDATGPVRSSLLRLSAGSTTTPRLLQQDLSSPRTPADLASAAGAVAAVNGDFFDIDRTGTPDGPVVLDGTPLKADAQPQTAVGVDAGASGWVGRLGQVLLQGSASLGGRTFPLVALGTRTVPTDSLALFTPAWGSGDRALTAPTGIELEVRSGRVSAVRPPGPTPVPGDGFVLVATGTVATALAGTALGTPATTELQVRDDALTPGSRGFALGARLELVRDGAVAAIDTMDPTWAALRARTAIGWSAGGDLLLLTIDGGTSRSRGVTAVETAQRMVQAGARGAVMLDGGGSAQLVARRPGETGVSEVAVPSDGAARPVANAIGLVPAAAAPVAASIVLRGNGSPTRLFPGLTGLVAAVPVNSAGAPVPGTPVVTSTDGAVATVEGSRVRGTAPGLSSLHASLGGAVGSLDVEVLDPLRRVDLETPTVLDGPGAGADVTLVGRDAEGRSAPLSAADVTVATDPAALRADPLPDGRLRLTALAAGPTSVELRLSAAGLTSTARVGVGTRPVLLDALDDPAGWMPSATRATASLRRVDVPDLPGVRAALRLDYDFTGQPAGTSTAALVARTPLPLPSGSREVVLQVRGDGQGGWLRGQLVVDGALRPVTFASRVDFTGWRTVRVPVPAGARSVALERIYLAQTSVAARRAGSLDVAALQATVPPVATTGTGAPDPALGPLAATGPRTARVAVVSGTSVSAARPSSAEHLAGELRRVVAAGAQRIVLAGDVVGSAAAPGTAQDVDLVRAVLARSLPPTVSWTWTAGDGEVGTPAAGGLSSAGPPATAVDVAGTRFVSVATRAGTIRGAEAHALTRVRDDLAAAGAASRSVVLVSAGPLTDPDESVLLGRWTEALRARGVRVAVVEGGAPAGVRREEEVLRVGTANAAVLSVAADQAGLPATARAAAPGTDDGWLRLQPSGPLVDRYERDVR
ncbi:phosphodiester glycosidase family protein [Kineococcus sp. GCM10028916]|uniref:phosphodiester glycosidase family protein n=1 Tax=Kineococcus sp. GCM10028916 TaxID=3273394 RepID=UPI003636574B